MALCTPQDGIDLIANLKLNNDSSLSNTALLQECNEITDQLREDLELLGYIEEGEDPETVCDTPQLLILKHIAACILGQSIIDKLAESIDPKLLGVKTKQKEFSFFALEQLRDNIYYPIFNPSSTDYSLLIGSLASVPTARPTFDSTIYSTVTLVSYLCPGWTPDSENQTTTDVAQNWINRLTIDVYALALKQGCFDLINLTLRQARTLGKIINLGTAFFVLQANAFADGQQQVSITAYEKLKEYLELRTLLDNGKLNRG